ncbi:L-threonylcarbamoyladenylate synthase [Leucobacter chinensis]|uniref:L-threonylcarbamoyladenylate synthase n=1 Tax=Leucobacter chinensis TaxID=2851010 RepID=UPI001C22AA89|nr:L-threonylcarbamoyladenylate synthase [Leucobacter chinensis]
MAELYDCSDASQLLIGARTARQAIGRGELIVLPTDTVYGVAADAFSPQAVTKLLEAKGRGRQSPPPVMVADMAAVGALAESVPECVERLAAAFWPGPLTIVLPAQPSLSWDLGDTGGTVALRIPAQDVTLEILRETGPLAVSSANKHGVPAAKNAAEADEMLGDSVAAVLDAGEVPTGESSTIVDATRVSEGKLRILRQGPVSIADLVEVCPELEVSVAPKRPAVPAAPEPGAAEAEPTEAQPTEAQPTEEAPAAEATGN